MRGSSSSPEVLFHVVGDSRWRTLALTARCCIKRPIPPRGGHTSTVQRRGRTPTRSSRTARPARRRPEDDLTAGSAAHASSFDGAVGEPSTEPRAQSGLEVRSRDEEVHWVTASSFTASPERPILQTMKTSPSRPRSRMVLAGIGVALGILTAVWLGFAIVMAAFVPGHWGDVLRISVVCLVVLAVSAVLTRIGRAA